MGDSAIIVELKELMADSLRLADILADFCETNLKVRGPCAGCSIYRVLLPGIRKNLKEISNKPRNPSFGCKVRRIFKDLKLTRGFWTFTQIPKGWVLHGAGFRQDDWPTEYEHPPIKILFEGPFLVEPLREICLNKVTAMLRGTQVGDIVREESTKMIDSLGIPSSIKLEISAYLNKTSWTGVLWRNHDPEVPLSDFFATWGQDTLNKSSVQTNMRIHPFSMALIEKVQIARIEADMARNAE